MAVMERNAMKSSELNWSVLVSLISAVMISGFVLACNFLSSTAKTSSDFLVSFYTAARLFCEGRGAEIYPAITVQSWQDAPINVYAHSILPQLPAELISNFMYGPLVALIMAPFGLLPPSVAISAWQLLSLLLLYLSCCLISRQSANNSPASDCSSSRSAGGSPAKAGGAAAELTPAIIFSQSLLFGPAIACLWVGQCSILFGVFPIAWAFSLFQKNSYLKAGLLLSVLQLKPQLLFFSIVIAFLSRQRLLTFAGLGIGLLAGFLLNFVLMPQGFLNWIHSLQLSEKFMGDAAFSMAPYLAASFPSAILLSLPPAMRSTSHILIYAVMFLLGLISLFFLARNATAVSSDETEDAGLQRLAASGLIAFLFEAIVAPRLVLYDCCILLVPLFYYSAIQKNSKYSWVCPLAIVLVDLYVVACLLGSPSPYFLTVGLAVISLFCLFTVPKKSST